MDEKIYKRLAERLDALPNGFPPGNIKPRIGLHVLALPPIVVPVIMLHQPAEVVKSE